uniref:Uncharacterized protein n=1 Tax=Romanomermis culicivorax TaxID=13658 RepID=A0A915JYX6_ROMCU
MYVMKTQKGNEQGESQPRGTDVCYSKMAVGGRRCSLNLVLAGLMRGLTKMQKSVEAHYNMVHLVRNLFDDMVKFWASSGHILI